MHAQSGLNGGGAATRRSWVEAAGGASRVRALAAAHGVEGSDGLLGLLEAFGELVGAGRNGTSGARDRRATQRATAELEATFRAADGEVAAARRELPGNVRVFVRREVQTQLPVVVAAVPGLPDLVVYIERGYAPGADGRRFTYSASSDTRIARARAMAAVERFCNDHLGDVSLADVIKEWASAAPTTPPAPAPHGRPRDGGDGKRPRSPRGPRGRDLSPSKRRAIGGSPRGPGGRADGAEAGDRIVARNGIDGEGRGSGDEGSPEAAEKGGRGVHGTIIEVICSGGKKMRPEP